MIGRDIITIIATNIIIMKGTESTIRRRSSTMIDGMIEMKTRIEIGITIITRNSNITDQHTISIISRIICRLINFVLLS